MRINPPTLFWILIAAILAAYLFLPLERFDRAWLPWAGGALAVLGIAISVAGKMRFQRAEPNVYTFGKPTSGTEGFTPSAAIDVLGLAGGLRRALAWHGGGASSPGSPSSRYWTSPTKGGVQRRFGAEYDAYCAKVRRWSGRHSQHQPAPRPARPD